MRRLKTQIGVSRLMLVLERGASAFWPVWTLGFIVYALAAFDVFSGLDRPVFLALLGGFALVAALLLVWGFGRFKFPARHEGVARLDDATPGRPVAALEDTQATGLSDPAAEALWKAHIAQMAERAATAKVSAPDMRVADKDPWGLRLIAVMALITALIFARGDGLNAVADVVEDNASDIALGPSYEAWAAPPAYTGKPVIYLPEIAANARIEVPEGTEISVRIYGDGATYSLSQSITEAPVELAQSAAGIAEATFEAKTAGSVVLLREEEELVAWSFAVTADTPPAISMSEPLSRTPAGEMQLHFVANDDWGVVAADVVLELDLDSVDRRFGQIVDPVPRDAIRLDLPMPFTGSTTAIEEVLVEDLSKHPWMGLPVRVILNAQDAAEQTGTEGPMILELPGRRFFDPLAAAIVEQRRDLLWSPENADRVDQILKAVTHRPDDIFRSKKAYLVVRAAMRRLGYAKEDGLDTAEVEDIAEFLWQAALLIEDGDLASAAERLRQAQDRLEDAIRNGATDEEIAELMQELREAMDEYMRQMARDAQENGQEMQQAQNQDGQSVNQNQLQEMLDEIQRLMEEGNMAEAQQLLEMLRQMMDNMRMAQQQGQQGQQGQGQQLMQDLQEGLRQQQQLSDESFQEMQRRFQEQRQQGQQGQQGQQQGQQGQSGQGQQGQQGQSGQGQQGQQGQNGQGHQPGQNGQPGGMPNAQQLAERQEALRGMIDGLRGQLPGGGEAGEAARRSLEQAERSMGEAADDLDDGNLPGALDNQADAMQALRDGIQNLGEQLRQQAQQNGDGQNPFGQLGENGNPNAQDPLGRPAGGNGNFQTEENLLPGEDAVRRSRELLEEIRRRAGDAGRPQAEREYLKRLLERF